MAPIVAITNSVGALFPGSRVKSIVGLVVQATDDEGGGGNTPSQEEAQKAFSDLLSDMTEVIIELMPGVDLDALGPFSGWISNLVVLIATLFAAFAVVQIFRGLGKMYVTSGGKKEKIKEGKDMTSSALIYLAIAVGLPIALMIITWFVGFITGN